MKKTSKIISSVVSVSIVLGTAVMMGVCSPELAPAVLGAEKAEAAPAAPATAVAVVDDDDDFVVLPAPFIGPIKKEVPVPVVAPAAEVVPAASVSVQDVNTVANAETETNNEVKSEVANNTSAPVSVPAPVKTPEPVVSTPAPAPAPVKKAPKYKSTIVLPDGSVCPIELNKVGKGNSANTVWLFMGDLDLTNNHYAWICGHNPGKFAPVASMKVGSRFVIWDVNGVDRQFEVVSREVHCVGEPFYCQDQNLVHSETMWIQTCIGGGKVAFLRCKMV